MPKHEIIHDAGTPVADELRSILKRHFSELDIGRLERLGGRVVIALTVPYISKSQREKSRTLVIDQKFIDDLLKQRNKRAELHRILVNLSEAQLRELCKRVGLPLGSKATASEIRAQLVQSLEAQDFWRRISGSAAPVESKSREDKEGR